MVTRESEFSEVNTEFLPMRKMILEMRAMALRALQRMYRREEKLFAFRVRRTHDGDILEGVSRRYTAIALLGLLDEPYEVILKVLAGQSIQEIVDCLIRDVQETDDLGEVALTLWLARRIHHPQTTRIFTRLREMDPVGRSWPTVELAWLLLALVAESDEVTDEMTTDMLARQLMLAFNRNSGLFPHRPDCRRSMKLRSHVACFADQVYPIQAMAEYSRARGNQEALEYACLCGQRICDMQGDEGQWWWHYDVRTGSIVEGYPVYAVHQDAMAPMALFALQEVSGMDYTRWIDRGISWLIHPPETKRSLIDGDADLIWRKIARHEPNRLVRGMQAISSRIHPALRIPGVNLIFRPGRVDYESRPYHMGWLLQAWPDRRTAQLERYSYVQEEKEAAVEVGAYSHWESWSLSPA
jgi:hypothetical protein